MAVSIKEVHDIILQTMADMGHGNIMMRHEDIDRAFNMAQSELFVSLMGGVNLIRRPSSADDASGYSQSMLSHLYTADNVTTDGSVLPFDWQTNVLDAVIHVNSNGRQRTLTLLPMHQYGSVVDSPVEAFAGERYGFRVPDGSLFGGPAGPGIVVWPAPSQPQTMTVFYYRRPPAVVYAYTISGSTETYDPANSVNPSWPDEVVLGIIIPAAMQYLGIQHDSPALVQYGLSKQAQKQ